MENHGQKRSADDQVDVLDSVQVILLDIEGTTTPIEFVKEKLFPYVRKNVKSYLTGHFTDEECSNDIDSLRQQASDDHELEGVVAIPAGEDDNQEAVIDAVVANIVWQMDKDLKTTALKQLQGHMWREAYKTGLVQGEIYDDVVPALRQWVDEGKRLYVYSSGSVEAQKLLFGYSDKGNLVELFSGYFDTNIGAKTEKDSYVKIAGEVNTKAEEVAFFTDLTSEAAAASEAGMKTIVVERKGNAALSKEDRRRFYTVSSFMELCGSDPQEAKRRDAEDDEDDDDDDDVVDDIEDGEDELDDLDGEDDDADEVAA